MEHHSRSAFAILSEPIQIKRTTDLTTIPLNVRFQKLFLNAAVNGHEREFIFDTGSPTILNRQFADSLDLQVIGQNTGWDANGREVTMDVAIVRDLTLGNISFQYVPVLIFDFHHLDLGACIFDGGVIGSEILPGSIWRTDTETSRLDIATSSVELPKAQRVGELYDLGYPHSPIIYYTVGTFHDKAMFDTGNAGHLILSDKAFATEDVQRRIVPGSLKTGRGSPGTSAGGVGEMQPLHHMTLSDFAFERLPFHQIEATKRNTQPTLIGAGFLNQYIVVLDYPSGELRLEKRRHSHEPAKEPGYAISIIDGEATVSQLFQDSLAAQAGLKLGDHVLSINAHSFANHDASSECEAATWLSENFDRNAPADIRVNRSGHRQMIHIPAAD